MITHDNFSRRECNRQESNRKGENGGQRMKELTIYLAGGMGRFGRDHFQMANEWRKYVKETLIEDCENKKLNIINPNDYFNFFDEPPAYASQREVMEFDLNKVRHSDLLIVNFNDMYSLGTMAEIAIAYERKIPIIGLNKNKQELHPWQVEMCNRILNDTNEMLAYVRDYYLS